MWTEEEAVCEELSIFGSTCTVDCGEELGQKRGRLLLLLARESHSEGQSAVNDLSAEVCLGLTTSYHWRQCQAFSLCKSIPSNPLVSIN